jgi:phosphoribosylamine---glycine ligase
MQQRVAILGSGAREHALAEKFLSSALCSRVFILPGNSYHQHLGWGIQPENKFSYEYIAECVYKLKIDCLVFGGETYLEKGWSDGLRRDFKNLNVIGPSQSQAKLETDKGFAKTFMRQFDIPTAHSLLTNPENIVEDLQKHFPGEVVIKATGLAGGKGVGVCNDTQEALAFLEVLKREYPQASAQILLEEKLNGPETSHFLFCATDQKPILLGEACDYKRRFRGNRGPNTGGMGSYSPCVWLSAKQRTNLEMKVLRPLQIGLQEISYTGFLYVGILWVEDEPYVLEFNVRMGDPECQIVQSMDSRDWLALILGKTTEPPTPIYKAAAGINVVMVSDGYALGSVDPGVRLDPSAVEKLQKIPGLYVASLEPFAEPNLYRMRGRCISVTAMGEDLSEARKHAYDKLKEVDTIVPGLSWRDDIAEL